MATVWVFFHGSFMNLNMLEEKGVIPISYEIGGIEDYKLIFQPTANLISQKDARVYGIAAQLTFNDLDKLYNTPISGHKYYPIPIQFAGTDNELKLCLTYVTEERSSMQPNTQYLSLILDSLKQLNIPDSYITYLESLA